MKLSSNRHRRLPIWEATKSMCSQAIPRWSDEVFRILGLVVCQDFVERIVHPEDLRGSFDEIGDRRNHRLGCFFHQPMS